MWAIFFKIKIIIIVLITHIPIYNFSVWQVPRFIDETILLCNQKGERTELLTKYKCVLQAGRRLNMEVDLQSLLGSCVQLYSLAETPQLPLPPPRSWMDSYYEGAIGQQR